MSRPLGGAAFDPRRDVIPVTEMLTLYRRLRLAPQADRLAMARSLERDPEALAGMFSRTVARFTPYMNPEPFHGEREHEPKPPTDLATGRHAIEHLWHLGGPGRAWSVEGEEDLGFRVVDYEVEITRTTRSPGFSDGAKSTAGLTTDLLLRGGEDRPIVCEVKAGTARRDDTDPFLALVQALAAGAHLATESQRARLATHYGLGDGPMDVYVLMTRPPSKRRSRHQDDLYEAARSLADDLTEHGDVARHVNRIAFIDARPREGGLELRHRNERLWPPRADVLACRADPAAQGDHDAEAARREAGPSARGCPSCGLPATSLEWFYFTSHPQTWEALCGTAGWVVWCDADQVVADYLEEVIN